MKVGASILRKSAAASTRARFSSRSGPTAARNSVSPVRVRRTDAIDDWAEQVGLESIEGGAPELLLAIEKPHVD